MANLQDIDPKVQHEVPPGLTEAHVGRLRMLGAEIADECREQSGGAPLDPDYEFGPDIDTVKDTVAALGLDWADRALRKRVWDLVASGYMDALNGYIL